MIKEKTSFIKKCIKKHPDLPLKNAVNNILKDSYKEETCYFLNCGSSINKVWSDELKEFLSDKFIISMKQTVELAPEIVDIHIFNESHYDKKWDDIRDKRTIALNFKKKRGKYDLFFPQEKNKYPSRSKEYFESTGNFDKWDMRKTVKRMKGLGVMHNSGIYLPILFGCRRVIIFGWDVVGKWFYASRARYPSDERKAMIKTIPKLLEFYAKNNCEILLCSPGSALPIKQISITEVLKGN